MEITLTVLQMALLSWAACLLGLVIGWFLAAMCTCGKIEDLERQIRVRDQMLYDLGETAP